MYHYFMRETHSAEAGEGGKNPHAQEAINWVIFQDRDGKELWSILWDENWQSYTCPTALPGGKFAVLRYVWGYEEGYRGSHKTLRILDQDGTVIRENLVSMSC